MADDQRFNREEHEGENAGELPASVIFMEMMRQAAEKSSAKTSVTPPKPKPPAPTAKQSLSAASEPQAALPVKVDEEDHSPAAPIDEAPSNEVITAASIIPTAPEPEAPAQPSAPNGLEPDAPQPEAVEAPTRRALTEEERREAAALEAQRIRRVKRRQEKRRAHRVSVLGGIMRTFLVIIPSALLMATIFSWWTDPQFINPEVRQNIQAAIAAADNTPIPPTLAPTPNWARKIGIVSGHNGPGQNGEPGDPGAVCPDGLTEREINLKVATLVVVAVREYGYSVDLLDEWDPRLNDYQAAAMVSIHANDCRDYGELVSGFLVAKAQARPEGGSDTLLAECIAREYESASALGRRFGLTRDMTDYHSFREIHPYTPAAIIELGFMLNDRAILTDRPDLLSRGITDGILCFLEPTEELLLPSPTP